MRVMTPIQRKIVEHIKTFLVHRDLSFKEDMCDLKGFFTDEHPESYVLINALNVEIFIYEDGHSQIIKDGTTVIDLEIESYNSIQKIETLLFDKMTELFGRYPS